MAIVHLELLDTRLGSILRLVGTGTTAKDAASTLGISRKTMERWRKSVPRFGEAYARAVKLSRDESPSAPNELDLLVRTWTPGGLVAPTGVADAPPAAVAQPSPAREPERLPALAPEPEPEPAKCVEPDVLDARGKELTKVARRGPGSEPEDEPAPYTTARPPTPAEWLAEMAALSLNTSEPARVRAVAIAAVSSALHGGPVRGRPDVPGKVEVEKVGGREPGVPASVWEQARKNFLGPAPDAEPDDARSGDVVELERAPG